MTVEQQTACEYCGEPLAPEEVEFPNSTEEAICDECDHECNDFVCCVCDNYEDNDYQDEIGCLLLAFEPNDDEKPELPVGVYEITEHPYYMQGAIGSSWIHSSSVRWLGPLPNDWHDDGYPYGHICRRCAGEYRAGMAADYEILF